MKKRQSSHHLLIKKLYWGRGKEPGIGVVQRVLRERRRGGGWGQESVGEDRGVSPWMRGIPGTQPLGGGGNPLGS